MFEDETLKLRRTGGRTLRFFDPSEQATARAPNLPQPFSSALAVGKAYGFPVIARPGANTRVGIIELGGGYRQSDLVTYFAAKKLPLPKVTAFSVDGARNAPTGDYLGPDAEVCLDIQVVGAIASYADIRVYFAPNTVSGFYNAIARALADRPCAISISWGAPEEYWSRNALSAYNNLFARAVASGVAVLAASGDGGSSDGIEDGRNHVDFPASSPNVTACGGTTLIADSETGVLFSERTWSGSGGGTSLFFARPTYQPVVPGARRRLPDLAGNADPYSGYEVLVSGQWAVYGGTSAVSPLVSALVSLTTQAIGRPCGFLNPALYNAAKRTLLCRDVLAGSNGAFVAGPGFDLATGWGSPRGANWATVFRNTPVARRLIGPELGLEDTRPIYLQLREKSKTRTLLFS